MAADKAAYKAGSRRPAASLYLVKIVTPRKTHQHQNTIAQACTTQVSQKGSLRGLFKNYFNFNFEADLFKTKIFHKLASSDEFSTSLENDYLQLHIVRV